MNVSPYGLIAALAGAGAAGGVMVAIAGVVGTDRQAGDRPPGLLKRRLGNGGGAGSRFADRRTLAAASLAVALVVWLLTSWMLGGLLCGAAVFGLPAVLQPGRGAKRQIERLEGLEEWVRRMADIHRAGISLEQAVATSARSAPKTVAGEIGALAARLASGWRPADAYRQFADELDDAAADSVAALMIMHAEDRGSGLSTALRDLARQLGAEVLMRRKVEADRAKPRANMRWVALFCLGMFALSVLSGSYVQPYDSTTGRVLLIALAAGFVAVMAWMRRMALSEPPPRFLAPTTPASSTATRESVVTRSPSGTGGRPSVSVSVSVSSSSSTGGVS